MSITTSMIYHRTWIIGAALAAPILPVSSQVPPNLVFIMADQYRGDALGCVGKEPVKTPCLDKLASEGILLTMQSAVIPFHTGTGHADDRYVSAPQ